MSLRIRRRSDFVSIARAGFYFRSSAVVVQCKKNSVSDSRVGFTASKKVGNAVIRNRCKRRLRSVARGLSDILSIGVDYVFIARKATFCVAWDVLFSECKGAVEFLNERIRNEKCSD